MIKHLLKKFGWTLIRTDHLEALLDADIPLMDIDRKERDRKFDIYLMARELYINSIVDTGFSNYEEKFDYSFEASIFFYYTLDKRDPINKK